MFWHTMQTCALLLGLVMLAGAREGRPLPPDETFSSECCEFLRQLIKEFLVRQEERMTEKLASLQQLERRLMVLETTCSRLHRLSIPEAPPATPSASNPPFSSPSPSASTPPSSPPSTSPTTPSSSSSIFSSTSAPSARDQHAERMRVQERIEEANAGRERARVQPSSLAEALRTAAERGSLEEVRRLLDEGADVNYITLLWASSPLMRAAVSSSASSPDVASLLLSRGADVNAVDMAGWSALHYAASYGNAPVVRLLLGAGAEVDARDEWGSTPLHWAAYYNHEKAVRALLAGGATKDLKVWSGYGKDKTPFDVARSGSISRNLLRT